MRANVFFGLSLTSTWRSYTCTRTRVPRGLGTLRTRVRTRVRTDLDTCRTRVPVRTCVRAEERGAVYSGFRAVVLLGTGGIFGLLLFRMYKCT